MKTPKKPETDVLIDDYDMPPELAARMVGRTETETSRTSSRKPTNEWGADAK